LREHGQRGGLNEHHSVGQHRRDHVRRDSAGDNCLCTRASDENTNDSTMVATDGAIDVLSTRLKLSKADAEALAGAR